MKKPWESHRKTEIVVRWTKDYDIFELLPLNREVKGGIDNAHVKQLALLISDKGFREELPIFVAELPNGKLGVLNGQHRLLACKTLDVEVGYTFPPKPFNEAAWDIFNDHRTVKQWNPKDCIRYFSEIEPSPNKESYRMILNFANKTGVADLEALRFFVAKDPNLKVPGRTRVNKKTMDLAKNGHLKLTKSHQTTAQLLLDKVDRIRNFSPNYAPFGKTAPFVSALCDLVSHEDYDERVMLDHLEAAPSLLTKSTSVKGYHLILQKIYNKGRRKDGQIFLSAEKGP